MKRYLVILLFIVSFITNTSVMASALFATNTSTHTMPSMTEQHADQLPMTESEHCHQAKLNPLMNDGCAMGEACDNCFTHCGGALLTAAFPHFVAQAQFFVAIQPQYYTPLLNTSFLRPPRTS